MVSELVRRKFKRRWSHIITFNLEISSIVILYLCMPYLISQSRFALSPRRREDLPAWDMNYACTSTYRSGARSGFPFVINDQVSAF